mgnify:CR=1 FL=1
MLPHAQPLLMAGGQGVKIRLEGLKPPPTLVVPHLPTPTELIVQIALALILILLQSPLPVFPG